MCVRACVRACVPACLSVCLYRLTSRKYWPFEYTEDNSAAVVNQVGTNGWNVVMHGHTRSVPLLATFPVSMSIHSLPRSKGLHRAEPAR